MAGQMVELRGRKYAVLLALLVLALAQGLYHEVHPNQGVVHVLIFQRIGANLLELRIFERHRGGGSRQGAHVVTAAHGA